jgi:5'(3')-deoxyribonucleotidase
MNLEQLNDEKKNIVGQINAYEELQVGLESIKKYNRENYINDELKLYSMAYQPHLEEITESSVAEKIEQLTNNLLTISEKINNIKMAAK